MSPAKDQVFVGLHLVVPDIDRARNQLIGRAAAATMSMPLCRERSSGPVVAAAENLWNTVSRFSAG